MNLLNVKNLKANIDEKEILTGLNLEIKSGEIHAIMGPNGTGKSTLSSVIMGDPKFTVTNGDILFMENSILDKEVDERARMGIFLAYQHPSELSGVTNLQFLKAIINAQKGEKVKMFELYKELEEKSSKLKMPKDYLTRFVNLGFSGGEKKRNEILQMLLLKPKLIILDEIDSGLDIDALKNVASNILEYYEKEKPGILIITHYPRILEYLNPNFVHIINGGKIQKTGGMDLAIELEKTGYEDIYDN